MVIPYWSPAGELDPLVDIADTNAESGMGKIVSHIYGAVQLLHFLDIHADASSSTRIIRLSPPPRRRVPGARGGLFYQAVKNGIFNDGLQDEAERHGIVCIHGDVVEHFKTVSVPFFYDKDIILHVAQLLCHCYKFPVILPKVVAEDLPSLWQISQMSNTCFTAAMELMVSRVL